MLGTLSPEQILDVLQQNSLGHLGCYDGARVYVVPINYAFHDTYIIAHAREGLKIDIMRQYPEVCFQVTEIQQPRQWRSVTAWGRYEEVLDEKEKYYVMKVLVGRLLHDQVSETARLPAPGEPRPILFRIRISESSGRFEG